MCIVNWINNYQGFVMSALTLIYVFATIRILSSNKQSASAAARANQQQYSLELLDKRLASYYCLNDWVTIAKSAFISPPASNISLDAFHALLFNNAKNETLVSMNKQIASIDLQIQHPNLPIEEKQQLERMREQLLQERFFKRVVMLDAEQGLINQIEILFPAVEFEVVKQFSDSFTKAVIDTNAETIEELKANTNQLVSKNMLETLWNIMKTI